ncbi:unnamed protein product [Protopolystoma xenopodis]|uniref:Uncharacterized protein n=1 Tax=Protopolystoma xenopodis TaxID=117903 RepID=A0A448XAA1_9PLAT|nr:unnamed protein product [Protopolystoma xenopodis]
MTSLYNSYLGTSTNQAGEPIGQAIRIAELQHRNALLADQCRWLQLATTGNEANDLANFVSVSDTYCCLKSPTRGTYLSSHISA